MQSILRNFKVKAKLNFIVAVAVLAIIAIQTISLNVLWTDLQQNKYQELANITDTAHSIIDNQRQLVDQGIKTTDQAQHDAKSLISTMRYGNNEYFFILDSNYKVLMHPLKPSLNDTVQRDFADSNGVKLFQRLVDNSIKDGSAIVDYMWPRAGSNQPIKKTSVAKYLPKWQWIIATGVYTDDLTQALMDQIWTKVQAAIAVILLTVFVAYQCARSILIPVEQLKASMIAVSNTRDLTLRVNLDTKDELSDMSNAFDQMLGSFEQILAELNVASSQVSATSVELSATTADTLIGMEHQKEETRLVANAMAEMSETVSEVANNIGIAADASRSASKATKQGQLIVEQSIDSVLDLSYKLQQAEQLTQNLEQQSSSISTIVEVISAIAEQTNLLALNAAIEAARAGEQGRGFAVVADEVRNLSSRTHQSTNEISEVIGKLQAGSLATAQAMQESKLAAQTVKRQSASVQDALCAIALAVEKIDSMTSQIASASAQQSSVTHVINKNIISINDISVQSAAGSMQVNCASTELASLSGHLQEIAQRFTLSSTSSVKC